MPKKKEKSKLQEEEKTECFEAASKFSKAMGGMIASKGGTGWTSEREKTLFDASPRKSSIHFNCQPNYLKNMWISSKYFKLSSVHSPLVLPIDGVV